MPLPLFLGFAAAAAAGAKLVKTQVDKAKETSATIEEAEAKCAAEAQTYTPQKTATELQEKMRTLLLTYAFSDPDKEETPPLSSDWRHLPNDIQICAIYHS